MTIDDPRTLRNAFGSFMTGVTIVTARDPQGNPVGFTANSFTSVSLDPPLLLVCPGRFLSSYEVFQTCTHFAVSILAEGQEDISNTFASFAGDRFARVGHHPDLHGIPLIDGAVARFSCRTANAIPAGDHCILTGHVEDFDHAGGGALGYAGGQYFSLGLERAATEVSSGASIVGAIIEVEGEVLLEKTRDGYRPPQTKLQGRASLLQSLAVYLSERGIGVSLGRIYSAYDDRRRGMHHTYVLAECTGSALGGSLHRVPVSDLPSLAYSDPAIARMMTRFATEHKTRSFTLYLGDERTGDTHDLSERN